MERIVMKYNTQSILHFNLMSHLFHPPTFVMWQSFFEKARQASLVILEGYALALSLDRHFFYQNHMGTETATTLRCLYYPSRPYGNDSTEFWRSVFCFEENLFTVLFDFIMIEHLRAGIHTDYGRSFISLFHSEIPNLSNVSLFLKLF
jgi:isopenicillin N synthase-like dioxygenase